MRISSDAAFLTWFYSQKRSLFGDHASNEHDEDGGEKDSRDRHKHCREPGSGVFAGHELSVGASTIGEADQPHQSNDRLWGNVDGLVISATVVCIAASRSSALFAMPPQRCDAASACWSGALVDEVEAIGKFAPRPTAHGLMGCLV